MRVVYQTLEDVLESLSPLDVDWMDTTAANVIARQTALDRKRVYDRADIRALCKDTFNEGLLCAGLFLGLSANQMRAALKSELGGGGIGNKRLASDPGGFLAALERLGLPEKMAATVTLMSQLS